MYLIDNIIQKPQTVIMPYQQEIEADQEQKVH